MDGYAYYNDSELTGLLKQGDRGAFNAIYYRYSNQLYKYAFNILQDGDECTDAIQDVFVWLWAHHEQLNISNLKAYLLAAVKYKLTRVISSGRRKAVILSRGIQPQEAIYDDSVELKELRTVINDFVNTLPLRAREIYQLSREHYFTNKEIAARMGISEKTVENQMTITLRKLKLHLGKMSFWSVFL